jgi:hypothetical protein
VHQPYITDIEASAKETLATVDPTLYFVKYGENVWAAVKGYLEVVTAAPSRPPSPNTPACWRRGRGGLHYHHLCRHAFVAPRPRASGAIHP